MNKPSTEIENNECLNNNNNWILKVYAMNNNIIKGLNNDNMLC